jgi:mitochondrial enoyl-[acyl-carrier protein] reductase / trans-2-enoyl-CoA reductase
VQRRLYHELSFARTGAPEKVLEYHHCSPIQSEPSGVRNSNSVLCIEVHHVPWNPADANTVQGTYPSPYSELSPYRQIHSSEFFPQRSVAGSEGYGRIVQCGGPIGSALQVGDYVTFAQPGLGTLRSSLWLPLDAVLPIQRGTELFVEDDVTSAAVATLFQLGGTALRMLTDFVKLKPGSTVIQNAGNSGVGILVSQLAKLINKNVAVVSVVRRSSRSPKAVAELTEYLTGTAKADLVLFEEDLIDNRDAIQAAKSQIEAFGTPVLALNALGGASSSVLLQLLDTEGYLVTYGGMSKQPIYAATSQLIFKNIKLSGYWNSRWMVRHCTADKLAVMSELVDAYLDKKLILPSVKAFGLSDFQAAIQHTATQSHAAIRSKAVFDCREL